MKTRFATAIATVAGAGYLKPGPGTWGSLIAALLAYPILELGGPLFLLFAVIIVTFIGIWASEFYEQTHNNHDPKEVVIDEVAGQWLCYLPLALWSNGPLSPIELAAGFAAFRLFDITKPWPIGLIDRTIGGGLGTMLDDLAAAIPAALLSWLFSIAVLGR